MSQRTNELMMVLQRAARTDDDGAFDMALGDLLARARKGAGAGAADRALVTQRLSGALAAAPLLGPVTSRTPEGTSAVLRGVRAVGLVAVGVAIGFSWGHEPRGAPDEQVREAGRATMSAAAPSTEVSPAATGIAPAATPATVAREPVRRTVASVAAPVPAAPLAPRRDKPRSQLSSADSLRFAIDQLAKAQLFSRAGEPARALRELDTLDAHVPLEVLREEREVARTLAWCDAGQVTKAKALASSLLVRSPDSAYAASLRESCAGKSTAEPINLELLEQMRERTSNSDR